ncbi:MAG: M48 family metalloprotease [Pseudomonadota bacterium]
MAYNNIIFFILSLIAYVTYIPKGNGDFFLFLPSFLALTGGYYLLTRVTYRTTSKKFEKEPHEGIITSSLSGTLEKKFILLALLLYLSLIYLCDLKNILWRITFLKQSSFLDLTAGFIPFWLFLMILWSNAFTLFRTVNDLKTDRKTYLLSHLRLNVPILLPVFFFSFLQDIFDHFFGTVFEPLELFFSSDFLWFTPLFILMMIFYPVVIRVIWGCYPFPKGARRDKIEVSCEKAGLNVSNIFIWPTFHGRSLTAGITGMVGKFRYFFITPELLTILNDDEIESVIAHEAGHVKKRHMYYYALLFFGFPLFMQLIFDLLSLIYYGFSDFVPQDIFIWISDPTTLSLTMLSFFAVFTLFYLRIFFGLLSRNFERQADLFVFEVVGHPLHLISSLEKISYYGGHGKDIPNWHHYSIGQRIGFLYACLKDRHNQDIHQKKVRTITRSFVSVFVLTLLLVGVLNYSEFRKIVKFTLMEEQVQRLIARNPQDIELKLTLADIYLEKKNYGWAESTYQQVLHFDPEHARALNNLAWLYATSEDKRFRNKAKALTLALKAAEMRTRDPYILDTLAETYFINGKRKEALLAIEEAIALKPEDMEYYLKQKQKFCSAPFD